MVKDRIRAAFLAVGLAMTCAVRAETNHEFWPELDLWFRLTDSMRILLVTAGTRADSGDRTNGEGAAYLDYHLSDSISLRTGYDYERNIATSPTGQDSFEHRLVLDFNYRWPLGEAGQLLDRTRVDIRDMAGEISYRVRNRIHYEREFKMTHVTLVPYAHIEAFYDSRFDTISRIRIESGTVIPFGKRFEGDFYVGWQRDTQPPSNNIAGLGVTLNCKF